MGCQGSTVERAVEFEVKEAAPCGFRQDFILDRKLGRGSFGTCYSARAASGGQLVAVKVVDLRPAGERGGRLHAAVEAEAAILRRLPKSPFVVEFHSHYVSDGLAYMVMEHGGTGLLRALESMQAFTEETLQPIFSDMLSGIAACHAAGIVHRDVKPDNFLAAPTARGISVKLCDFGVAGRLRFSTAEDLEGLCGTPPYMAPEMIAGSCYGAKVDVWALGVVAYVLLFGTWPYLPATRTGSAMKAAILVGRPAPRFCGVAGVPGVSGPCSEWVQALLCRRAASRPTAAAALRCRAFSAPWRAGPSLRPALSSAKRLGAFDLHDAASQASTDLDRFVLQMNTDARLERDSAQCTEGKWMSEASTAASPGR